MSPTLGQQLRRARELQYLTLADLAHETRIPASRLRDLENDEYTTFGGVAYVRFSLKAYATRLEVDAEETLARLAPPRPPERKSGLPWLRRGPDWNLPNAFARRQTPAPGNRNLGKATIARDPMGRELKAMAMVCTITLLLGASYLVAQAYQQNREDTPAPTASSEILAPPSSSPSGPIEIRRAGDQAPEKTSSVSPLKAIPVGPEPPVVKAELVK